MSVATEIQALPLLYVLQSRALLEINQKREEIDQNSKEINRGNQSNNENKGTQSESKGNSEFASTSCPSICSSIVSRKGNQ